MDLKDEQVAILERLLPKVRNRADGKGHPSVDDCMILNGILWILRTGAAWNDLPNRYPPHQTCHRWLQEWVARGDFQEVLRALVRDVKERGGPDLTERFIDGNFVIAKKRGRWGGKTRQGQGTRLMALADGAGVPLAISLQSAARMK